MKLRYLVRTFHLFKQRPYLSTACLGSTSTYLCSSLFRQKRVMAALPPSTEEKKNDLNNDNNDVEEQHKYTNALINEKSPYLLQHAHNPVNIIYF